MFAIPTGRIYTNVSAPCGTEVSCNNSFLLLSYGKTLMDTLLTREFLVVKPDVTGNPTQSVVVSRSTNIT